VTSNKELWSKTGQDEITTELKKEKKASQQKYILI
jgi:hypothetical protein